MRVKKHVLAVLPFLSSLLSVVCIYLTPLCNAQTPQNVYVCGKDFCKPFALENVGSIRFGDSAMLVGNRHYRNTDVDSITFLTPSIVADLGMKEETMPERGAAILDVSSRNEENETEERNVYSAWYMLNLAGMPFFVTADIDNALTDTRLLLVSSVVKNVTFSESEIDRLREWVEGGGILVIPAATPGKNAQKLKELVGYGSARRDSYHNSIIWNAALLGQPQFEYVDTPEETTISIGRRNRGFACYHIDSLYSDADTLAVYNNDEIAAVRHKVGLGEVYSFGVLWGQQIQLSQLNRDPSAQRSANNTFEPSSDIIALQIRSIYTHQGSPSVWKFTIPDGYESLLIPTHDCDSKTALDSMYYMSEYEKSIGAHGHYFITTHYYAEPQDSGDVRLGYMYTPERLPKIRQLIADGHTVGSHSIGHFPDFSVTARFPMTMTTREDYHALYSNVTDTTAGGSTWAEVVLSKQILQGDLGNNVQSFRTGHLCMNDSIPHAEQIAGYKYASCFTASDVLSEFPYQERLGRVASGDFNGVLEMPLHISDVFNSTTGKIDATNWPDKVEIWKTVHSKLAANYAPAIILIHPNRKWKMEAEQALVDSYDHDRVGLYNLEAYGRFWNVRAQTNFAFGYDAQKDLLTIHLDRELSDYGMLTFAIEGLPDGARPTVHLTSPDNTVVAEGRLRQIAQGRYLCVF